MMGFWVLLVNAILVPVFFVAVAGELIRILRKVPGWHELKIAACVLIMGMGVLAMRIDIRLGLLILVGLVGLVYSIWQVDMINRPILGLIQKVQEALQRREKIIRKVASWLFTIVVVAFFATAFVLPLFEETKWLGITMLVIAWLISVGVLSGFFNRIGLHF